MELDVKYPCGYHVKYKSGGFFEFSNIEFVAKNGCPLHEKNCKQENGGKNGRTEKSSKKGN